MNISENATIIKQECIDDELDIEEFELKDEPCSTSSFFDATNAPDVKEEMDPADIHLIPKDFEFIKCEPKSIFNLTTDEIDPLLLTKEEQRCVKTEVSSHVNNFSSHNTNNIPVENKNISSIDINTECLDFEEDLTLKVEENESVPSEYKDKLSDLDKNNIHDSNESATNDVQHESVMPYTCSELRTHRPTGDTCYYSTGITSHLKWHLLTHTGEKQFKCTVCNYSTNLKSSLKRHLITHTGEKPFKCTICNYSANQKCNLKNHLLTHTTEKLFKCTVCNYSVKQKPLFEQHLLIHARENPFKCTVCNYSTDFKWYLKRHLLIHNDEKLFKCTLCDYSTTCKSNLRNHSLNHIGEQPFKCTVCDYFTIKKSNLNKHLLTHTRENPLNGNNTVLLVVAGERKS